MARDVYDVDLIRFGSLIAAAGVALFFATWRPRRTNRGPHWHVWAAAWLVVALVGAAIALNGLARAFVG